MKQKLFFVDFIPPLCDFVKCEWSPSLHYNYWIQWGQGDHMAATISKVLNSKSKSNSIPINKDYLKEITLITDFMKDSTNSPHTLFLKYAHCIGTNWLNYELKCVSFIF